MSDAPTPAQDAGPPFELPSGMSEDLQAFSELPGPVKLSFWEVLEPHLTPNLDDRVEAVAARFARAHGLEQSALGPSIRAMRFLCMQGAALAVPPPRFSAAIATIGLPSDTNDVISALYEHAYSTLRSRIIARTLGDHGDVVVGIDWRVDDVRISSHGRTDDLALVIFTFRTQRGDQPRRYTLQFMPEQIGELRAILDRFS
jgi:hypothetical protein